MADQVAFSRLGVLHSHRPSNHNNSHIMDKACLLGNRCPKCVSLGKCHSPNHDSNISNSLNSNPNSNSGPNMEDLVLDINNTGGPNSVLNLIQ